MDTPVSRFFNSGAQIGKKIDPLLVQKLFGPLRVTHSFYGPLYFAQPPH